MVRTCGAFAARKTAAFLAGSREDGLIAPALFQGRINGDRPLAYVEQVLDPDDTLLIDNLSSHKKPAVARAIKAVGASVGSCRPIAPTSIPSSRCSPRSRRCAGKSSALHRCVALEECKNSSSTPGAR
jgi:hypothetical protein